MIGLLLLILASFLSTLPAVCCLSKAARAHPLSAGRRFWGYLIRFFCRLWLSMCGFRRVRIKGKRASFAEAPILVSNHIGMFESLALLSEGPTAAVSAEENSKVPVLGHISAALEFIAVNRTAPSSQVQEAIKARADLRGPHQLQTLIFPEGIVLVHVFYGFVVVPSVGIVSDSGLGVLKQLFWLW
jgi:1-acyl-sn-glycerol-3-phosphate acyltransferase